jgi:hypothetical protein
VKIKTPYTYCEQVDRRGKDCEYELTNYLSPGSRALLEKLTG